MKTFTIEIFRKLNLCAKSFLFVSLIVSLNIHADESLQVVTPTGEEVVLAPPVVDEDAAPAVVVEEEVATESAPVLEAETEPEPVEVTTAVQAPEVPTSQARPDQTRPGPERPLPLAQSPVLEVPAATQCTNDSQNVEAMQQRIFLMSEDSDTEDSATLMELLVIQDELKAREAVVKGLISIWDEYNSYLSENEQLRQSEGNSHLTAQNAVGALNRLKGFIDNNSQAVSRYHLLSEAFSQFDPAQFQGKSREEVFTYIKSSMQNSCQDPLKARTLGYCQEAASDPHFWETMAPQSVAATNPQNSSDIIHKFIEVTSISARDWGPTDNWMENLSTLFVDQASINGDLLADNNLSEIVSEMIEDTIDECRRQALVSTSREVDCLADSQLIENHPQREMLTNKLNLLNPGQPREFRNMRDIVDAYLENAEQVSSAHHENVGGTISALSSIASQRATIDQQIASGNQAIQEDLQDARENLKTQANVKMAVLGRNLQSINNSKRVFANYMNTVPGLELGTSEAANQIINELMGSNAPGQIFQRTENDTFKITDEAYERIFTDPNFSKESLTALLHTPQENFDGQSITEAKASIASRIARIRATQEYKDAEAFKNFAWQSLLASCREEGVTSVQEVIQPTCQEESTSEVNTLLQVGNSFISYQSDLDDQIEVSALNRRCQELYNLSAEEYDRNGYTTLCNEINRADIQNTRRVTEESSRSTRRERPSRRRIVYYEEDGITPRSAYTPRSNFSLFLPAAASAFTTILPTWSQTPLYQSYALQGSIAGKQEKTYNAWLAARNQSILNQTVCLNGIFNCYLPSTVTPGVSPTLGNTAFSFGQSSTVFGSTNTAFPAF